MPFYLESEFPKSLSAFLIQAASRQPWDQLMTPLAGLHPDFGTSLPIAPTLRDWEGCSAHAIQTHDIWPSQWQRQGLLVPATVRPPAP
jgi:hypothetical protein